MSRVRALPLERLEALAEALLEFQEAVDLDTGLELRFEDLMEGLSSIVQVSVPSRSVQWTSTGWRCFALAP